MQKQLASLWAFFNLVTNSVSPFDHPFSREVGGVKASLATRDMQRRDDLPNVPSAENFVRRAFHACEYLSLSGQLIAELNLQLSLWAIMSTLMVERYPNL